MRGGIGRLEEVAVMTERISIGEEMIERIDLRDVIEMKGTIEMIGMIGMIREEAKEKRMITSGQGGMEETGMIEEMIGGTTKGTDKTGGTIEEIGMRGEIGRRGETERTERKEPGIENIPEGIETSVTTEMMIVVLTTKQSNPYFTQETPEK